jgi:hypothetical protein
VVHERSVSLSVTYKQRKGRVCLYLRSSSCLDSDLVNVSLAQSASCRADLLKVCFCSLEFSTVVELADQREQFLLLQVLVFEAFLKLCAVAIL